MIQRIVTAGKPLAWASLLSLLGFTAFAFARILPVPVDYPTINAAITASLSEDTILVDWGIYPEQLRFPSHRVYVMSHYELTHDTLDATQTVIEGYSYADHDTATIALFLPGAADSSKLCGFTLRGGHGIGPGYRCGAFLADSCSPVICHNVLTDNNTVQTPTGEFWHCSGVFRGNQILGNEFGSAGLRVFYNVYSEPVLIEGNTFGPNPASPNAGRPGINLESGSRALIRDNRFHQLSGFSRLGISANGAVQLEVTRNVFDSITVHGIMTGVVWINSLPGDVVVSDNVFSNVSIEDGAAVMLLQYQGVHDAQVEGNVFEHIYRSSTSEEVVPGVWLQRYTATVRNNIFRDLYGDLAAAFYVIADGGPYSPLTVEYNLFEACSTSFGSPWAAVVMRFFNGPVVARSNIFRYNWPRVVTDDHLFPSRVADFAMNYWGDPSGPYHPILNPNGLGDAVGDSVLFNPWLPDSIIDEANEALPPLPEKFVLESYPNPFNPQTKLKLTVPEPGRYKLELYDLTGRKVRKVFEGAVVIDREVTLSAGDLPSGVYFARASDIQSRRSVATVKLVLLR